MSVGKAGAPHHVRASPYVVLIIALWTAAMTVRLYPQFETAVRINGRVTTVDEYIADRCSARLGPAAEACLAAAHRKAQIQLRREQAKTVLIIVAPAVLYLVYLSLAGVVDAFRLRAAKQRKDRP